MLLLLLSSVEKGVSLKVSPRDGRYKLCLARHLHCTAFNFSRTQVFSAESGHFCINAIVILSSDENGKDQGVNVRQRVKEMVELVQDDDRLREERKKAKKNKDKYVGVSSETMGHRGYCKSDLSGSVRTDG